MGRWISVKCLKVRGFKRVQREREREGEEKRKGEKKLYVWGNRSRIMDGEERKGKGNKKGNQ